MSAASDEATRDTTEFEHFGRTWTVPSKARFTHMESLQRNPSDVGIVHTFLDADQVKALRDIDPDADELDAFTDAIVAALGLKNSGNSSPSSASS